MAHEILVVDDEADIRLLISGILEDEGYHTREAADSDEALDAILTRLPALIILDIWLQGSRMDGIELLESVKQMQQENEQSDDNGMSGESNSPLLPTSSELKLLRSSQHRVNTRTEAIESIRRATSASAAKARCLHTRNPLCAGGSRIASQRRGWKSRQEPTS